MTKPSDMRVVGVRLYLLPIPTRVPLKFGGETLTEVTCARVCVRVRNRSGTVAEGWGETPLSVQWAWPGALPFAPRLAAMRELCRRIARAWAERDAWGHALELGWDFAEEDLLRLATGIETGGDVGPIPRLAALICASAFDVALHDAFGNLVRRPTYETYTAEFLTRSLTEYFAEDTVACGWFQHEYPDSYLQPRRERLLAWHLVGGLDPVSPADLRGDEPRDGHPVLLEDWIRRDGLKCLKVKLRGTDEAWDYDRLVAVGRLAVRHDVWWLSADFNCTVHDPEYVNGFLDRLRDEEPRLYGMLLYVEQPFPYDLPQHALEVRSVAGRKPLFLDESAHDWRLVRLGRQLGWTGVALKTCKTQSGALLSLCWARAHGMSLMVQDLTNPMLAQLPHLLLAAHAGTLMGVETNSMQFYPDVSAPEAEVHPGCFRRQGGRVSLATLRGPGFGYRCEAIARTLPEPHLAVGDAG